MPRILFTGGGTAGHVTPSLALIEHFRDQGWELAWGGSHAGIERELIEPLGIPYFPLATGKLRRYLSLENLWDLGRTAAGIAQGWRLCRRWQPDVVFSKGGFVSVPLIIGAWAAGVPVVAHESDFSPGLATRLASPFARVVCTTFAETRVPRARRQLHTGTPLRTGLLSGKRARGLAHAGLEGRRPVLLVVGGSLGSQALNGLVRAALPQLLQRFEVIHICGTGNAEPAVAQPGYAQFEFVREPYADLLAAADLVISRAGANGLLELVRAGKPCLLVPLGVGASRGDQIENAGWAVQQGLALTADERELDGQRLLEQLEQLSAQAEAIRARLANLEMPDARQLLVEQIEMAAGVR